MNKLITLSETVSSEKDNDQEFKKRQAVVISYDYT
jgi:hypothetical protein